MSRKVEPSDQERSRAKEMEDMLNEACKQPGVREAMEVYENWRKINMCIEPYFQVMSARRGNRVCGFG